MNYTEVIIFTTTAGIDRVADVLETVGIEGYVLEDAADFAEFLQDTQIYWDYVDEALVKEKSTQETKLKVYLPQDEDGAKQYKALLYALEELRARDASKTFGRLETAIETVRQEDWEWGWKQYFKPFTVGERFVIKPSWETYTAVDERMVLEIDPASSFGTGSHETTQLCMLALEQAVSGGEKLLDMGTGSGILAIAAAQLGAQVEAVVDIDENCLRCAAENAHKNGVAIGTGYCGDAVHDAQLYEALGAGYDIIVANIVADVIIAMRPLFAEKLKPGGLLIASGVLDERAEEVADALKQAGFAIHEQVQRGDWVRFTAVCGLNTGQQS